jgi:hypothetical protein
MSVTDELLRRRARVRLRGRDRTLERGRSELRALHVVGRVCRLSLHLKTLMLRTLLLGE